MDKKIRIAFIKFGGLSVGGTEMYLQAISANLSKDKFIVDYFYCDTAPYVNSNYKHLDTDPERLKFMEESGINLIKFKVGFKDVTKSTHDWLETNFWELFKEENYDVIFTGRSGHSEYPFYLIKKIPIIDSLHLNGGSDNQNNIKKVIHLSEWHAKKWIGIGGDRRRSEVIYPPYKINKYIKEDYQAKYNLNNKFIYGFHQRNDDNIFSPIPLLAYSKIETTNTHFVILNGSSKYKEQSLSLGIKNITFLPFAKTLDEIYNFLEMLNVYAHGRRDGETSGGAIAEAMAFGLPVISHYTKHNNGQLETIGQAGKMVKNVEKYAKEMQKMMNNPIYYRSLSTLAKERFTERYSFEKQIERIEKIITETVNGKIEYNSYHWSVLLSFLYKIKFYIRCKLVKIVKYFLNIKN
ncbi:MAG: glycosyltransferase family 4 protein [bacterium]